MNQPLLFPILIIAYILSLVLCIVSASVSKKINSTVIRLIIVFHLILILTSLLFNFTGSKINAAVFFAFYFCSGNILFGMVSRRVFPLPAKIYFGIFVLSFPVFLFSPSLVLSVISLGELKKDFNSKVPLGNSYFLEKQGSMFTDRSFVMHYKVIKRIGYFNKTIARDLYFSASAVDSAKLLDVQEGNGVYVRGYFLNKKMQDSADVFAPEIKNARDTLIQIKKHKK
ncbi:MAG TPA: hypothetical protein PKN75_11965 [Bacteroidia bacterium]|nr:hypothetical protein [Bacteroidia bacterium]HNU34294.1 hypothetical protein [Bacteroidia bacterium]